MTCLIALLALALPRITMIILVVSGDYLGRAYQTTIWPLLGFLFMPFTTLAYAFAINERGSVSGWYAALLVVAVLMDLGAMGGSESTRRKRRRCKDC